MQVANRAHAHSHTNKEGTEGRWRENPTEYDDSYSLPWLSVAILVFRPSQRPSSLLDMFTLTKANNSHLAQPRKDRLLSASTRWLLVARGIERPTEFLLIREKPSENQIRYPEHILGKGACRVKPRKKSLDVSSPFRKTILRATYKNFKWNAQTSSNNR